MTYYIYKNSQGYWRWTLESADNRKIAKSGEVYYNEAACLDAVNLVKGSGDAAIEQRQLERDRLVRV